HVVFLCLCLRKSLLAKLKFITIQSLACFKANVKIYQQYGTNYIPSVIRRHISARSSVVMEPHNSLITSGNLLAD
ncbi:hypothetical protein, partial [Muribaculum intestinale]|uniref:hypothetical protein n=1 Tax=Muribaculum intestinale TaxID=1796646 RepID=UPI00272B8937